MVASRLFHSGDVEMPDTKLTVFFLVPLVLVAFPAQAYIGPAAGAGTIAVVLGILASIVMAFFAILWYPVKRLLKKWKATRQDELATKSEGTAGSEEL